VKNLFVRVYLISFSLVALAQDTSYSTDSLMAAFSKGSHLHERTFRFGQDRDDI